VAAAYRIAESRAGVESPGTQCAVVTDCRAGNFSLAVAAEQWQLVAIRITNDDARVE
ncbi:uncharacterized protein METZ01_LOCUS17091, partial [marine metagenome]